MALTISSRPSPVSNTSTFVVTTDLVEDSTHVNLRIEAELYYNSLLIAKKSKPKGITTFDFSEILKSKIGMTTPAIDMTTTGIKDVGITGSNLITSWTQNGNFTTFTTSGANWTNVQSGSNSEAYTNAISVTAGKIYVITRAITTYGEEITYSVKTTPANGNVITGEVNTSKMYMQFRTTGTINIQAAPVSDSQIYVIDYAMYEMNATDWYAPYYVKFTEKYEDASGVTTTGASVTDDALSMFVNTDSVSAHQLTTTDKTFMINSEYYKITNPKSYSIQKTNQTSLISPILMGFLGGYSTNSYTPYLYLYTANDVFYTNSAPYSYTTCYGVLSYLVVNNTAFSSNVIIGYKVIGSVSVGTSEYKIYYNQTLQPEVIRLIWLNSVGGFSAFSFINDITKGVQVEKEYYKDSNRKNKLIPNSVVSKNILTATTPIGTNEYQLSYISDLLSSKLVYMATSTGTFIPVTVVSEEISTKESNDLNPFTVEIEW